MSFTPETLQRQWQTLRLIPRHPRRISATDLHTQLSADGYKIAKRTVERDLQTLSSIFPLVADERAKPYGWSWHQDAPAFDLPGLSNSEALTLLLAREHLAALLPASTLTQLRPHFWMAESKLASLGEHSGAADWMDKVRVIPATQPLLAPQIDADVQATINDALLLGKQVQVSYRKRDADADETYPIHPLGLVQRGQVLYLVLYHQDLPAPAPARPASHPVGCNPGTGPHQASGFQPGHLPGIGRIRLASRLGHPPRSRLYGGSRRSSGRSAPGG